jgi:hypothetical protein
VTERERDGDDLRLPCEGLRVSQIIIDHSLRLELTGDHERADEEAWSISIITPFLQFWAGGVATTIDPEGPAYKLAPALTVRGQTLTRGRSRRDGQLRLEFGNGDVLEVPVHDHYEAWTATGGSEADRMFFVSPIAPDTYL